jgi:hypothetical protein
MIKSNKINNILFIFGIFGVFGIHKQSKVYKPIMAYKLFLNFRTKNIIFFRPLPQLDSIRSAEMVVLYHLSIR